MKKKSIKTMTIDKKNAKIVYKFDGDKISPRKAKKIFDGFTKKFKQRRVR